MAETRYVWMSDETLGRFLNGWRQQVWHPRAALWVDFEFGLTEGREVTVQEARNRMRAATAASGGTTGANPFDADKADGPTIIPRSSDVDAAVRAHVSSVDYVDRDTGEALHGEDEFPPVEDEDDDG